LNQFDVENENEVSPTSINIIDSSRNYVDTVLRAESEPPLAHGSGSPDVTQFPKVSSYNEVENEFKVRGSKHNSPREHSKKSGSPGNMQSGNPAEDEVKHPEGIRENSSKRRFSIFSSCTTEDNKRERADCNRETLLAIIANLEKDLKDERALRRITERMLSDSQMARKYEMVMEGVAMPKVGVNSKPTNLEIQSGDVPKIDLATRESYE